VKTKNIMILMAKALNKNDIYKTVDFRRELIMDHYENPVNFVKDNSGLVGYKTSNVNSPSCIDNISAHVKIENGKIQDIKFSGVGCAIATSSTDLMASKLLKKDIASASHIINNYLNMVDGKNYDELVLDELVIYDNVNKQLNRIKCAKVGIEAISKTFK
jgi:nitrogen fixation NifU-like protein